MNKKYRLLDMLENEFSNNTIDDFAGIVELFSKVEPTKEELKVVIYSYDIYTVYHMLFELFGCEMGKDEYIKLRKKYVKTFDLEFVPLPECCSELDEKWGLKNV